MAIRKASPTPSLIRAYGEFWNPSLVDWSHSYKMLGTDGQKRLLNAYEQRGIYVLYQEYVPVYVGKADKQSIGYRLKGHRESVRRGPRWDRFSWFGLRRFNRDGELADLKSAFHPTTSELISTLEALIIMVADPRLNSRRERLKDAVLLHQSDEEKPTSHLEQQLAAIHKKLDTLMR